MPTERGEEGERANGRKILGYNFDSLFIPSFRRLSPGTAGPGRPVGGRCAFGVFVASYPAWDVRANLQVDVDASCYPWPFLSGMRAAYPCWDVRANLQADVDAIVVIFVWNRNFNSASDVTNSTFLFFHHIS